MLEDQSSDKKQSDVTSLRYFLYWIWHH